MRDDSSRKHFLSYTVGIFTVMALSFQANAVPLTTGNTVLTSGATVLNAGTVLTNEVVVFSGVNGSGGTNFTGTLQLQVVKETGSGSLDFYYQIFNNSSSADAIMRLTAGNYTGFATDVDWTNNAAIGVGSTYADRTTADTVGFSFVGAPIGRGAILPGTNSALLFIKTDATQYTLGTVSLINNATANVLAFAPIPEPSTWALIVLGGAVVFGFVRPWREE